MADKKKTDAQKSNKPMPIRLGDLRPELETIAAQNGIALCDAVRMAARFGAPILKKRLALAVEEAA